MMSPAAVAYTSVPFTSPSGAMPGRSSTVVSPLRSAVIASRALVSELPLQLEYTTLPAASSTRGASR